MGCSALMTGICQQTCPCDMYAGMHSNQLNLQSNPEQAEEALSIRCACMPIAYGVAPAEPVIVALTVLHEHTLSVLGQLNSHKVQAGLKSTHGL